MKKIMLFAFAAGAMSLASCKKDRVCECTTTHTSAAGTVTTDPAPVQVTYKDIRKHDARSVCEKLTTVNVNNSGGTSTDASDCKLK